ncbi:MAG TPA: DUF4430 domain-containing protein [Solirubrobacteraceae bacterium]|nr:DUF4430 domain-containing protein [Solirubrobacteraceae bacterium]
MRRRTRPVGLIAATVATAVLLGGCGLGAGPGTRNAQLLVTANFGTRHYGSVVERRVPGSETVLSLLERHFKITTRYGGGFVESIAGHSGSSNHLDWFYYVNGIEAADGAAATDVHAGDHVWWDLHDWAAAESVPAVVGSFPEPFTSGLGGHRFPTLLDCAPGVQTACDTVGADLHRLGVKAADQALGTGSGSDSLSVVIGAWRQLRSVLAAQLIAAGPRSSGVYARFTAGGSALALEDPHGRTVRTLRGSVGLIAATGQASISQPLWFITGTDRAGVLAAARALTVANLAHHFAVAVVGRSVMPVPLAPGS